MRDALERDKSMIELRALLASYEERLSRSPATAPEGHASQAYVPEPLLMLNDMVIDLRASVLENCAVIEAPAIVDSYKPEEPEPFSFVYKVSSGVFRVHPRQARATAAVLGPFSGPAPTGIVATAQTTHPAAPPVRFHIATWLGEFDTGTLADRFGEGVRETRWLSVPPHHRGYLVATDCPQPEAPTEPPQDWGLLLVTIADPPEEISNAWAEFSNILLIFATDGGSEVRVLS